MIARSTDTKQLQTQKSALLRRVELTHLALAVTPFSAYFPSSSNSYKPQLINTVGV